MKNILVIYFSQTNRVKSGLEKLLEPSRVLGHTITYVRVQPKVPYPFPWGFFRFFGAFPNTVLGRYPEIVIPPFELDKQYDVVVMGFPVWFLSIAPPIQAFLASKVAAVLNGNRIIAFVTCRELWWQGVLDFKNTLLNLGGILVETVVLKERMASWKTYLSTPVYLITGKQFFSQTTKRDSGYDATLQNMGEILAKELQKESPLEPGFLKALGPAPYNPSNLIMEKFGKRTFHWCAAKMAVIPDDQKMLRRLAILLFFLYLIFLIPILKCISKWGGGSFAVSLCGGYRHLSSESTNSKPRS